MPKPTDLDKHPYMFSDDMKFVQKIVVWHPRESKTFLALQRSSDSPTRPDDWDLPGGNVLFGEHHLESLSHEIEEETGLSGPNKITPVFVSSNFRDGVYILFIGYTATALSDRISLSHEHQDYRWVTAQDFLTLCSASYLHEFIRFLPE